MRYFSALIFRCTSIFQIRLASDFASHSASNKLCEISLLLLWSAVIVLVQPVLPRYVPLHQAFLSSLFFFKRSRCFKEFEEEIEYSGNNIVPAMFGPNITKRLLFWVQMRKADLGDLPFGMRHKILLLLSLNLYNLYYAIIIQEKHKSVACKMDYTLCLLVL